LLDTTIRAQAGTWVVHNLSDVRDIGITISSAEDLSNENKEDISGLEKGEAIICGEAVRGIPLFVKVRKRRTKHGGIGFNPLDFLSEQTVGVLQNRKQKLLGNISADKLAAGKTEYEESRSPKSPTDYTEEISILKRKIEELEGEVKELRLKVANVESQGGAPSVAIDEGERIEELKTEINVWKEKYNYLKEVAESEGPAMSVDNSEQLSNYQYKIIELEAEVKKYKEKYSGAMILATKSIEELKKSRR
jgi:hypothetical protein